jgi:hypothetical protein
LAAVASALPGCREARFIRHQFDAELCELLNAHEVELRDGPAMPRPSESSMSVYVVSRDLKLGAIDATFDEGSSAFNEWDLQLRESARQCGALVMIFDRAQRAGGLAVSPRCQTIGRRRWWDRVPRSAASGREWSALPRQGSSS